jgi:uncharacterized RDD family membrane protein YckC
MVHDIFISYAKDDSAVADTICANLEQDGIRCWIAPRNISPGEKYATAIIHAIENAKIVVVVFSRNSDQSAHVRTEVERAFNQGKIIIPFRIENIEPSDELQYFIGSRQWLDAFAGPYEEYARQLAQIIKNRLTPDSNVRGSQEPPSPKASQFNPASAKTENEYVEIGPTANRSIAYLIDLGLSLIVGIIFLIAILGMEVVWGGVEAYNKIMFLEDGITNSALGNFFVWVGILMGMILFLTFFDIFSSLRSPGKRLFSLKISKLPASSQSKTWRIMRSLIKNTPLILMFFGFGLLSIHSLFVLLLPISFILEIIWVITLFVTPKSQSVHDLVTGTIVISAKKMNISR